MPKRIWITVSAVACLIAALVSIGLQRDGSRPTDNGPRLVAADLGLRDPQASPQARRVYTLLADLENNARRGGPTRTVIGQHVEVQNERYNEVYGDYRGLKQPGYYYGKAKDITGKLPGFVEVDLGPGYGEQGWAVGEPRSYSGDNWPSCRARWGYTEDAMDLAVGVWAGIPRPDDGSYNPRGTRTDCASGSVVSLPENGGAPAGLVGVSFHQPYPGSGRKGYEETLCRNSPAAHDSGWFSRVVDPGTTEHKALLRDLDYLADHLGYLAEHRVPVLFRPYHEMNAVSCQGGFWWAAQSPAAFRKLWRITYDHLVNGRGLHNLIFVWAPSAWDGRHGGEPWAYYPGADSVDVVGVDDYSDTPDKPFQGRAWTSVWYSGLERYRKPRIMAESFHVPLGADRSRSLSATPWVLWTVWGQALSFANVSEPRHRNTAADVKATYHSPQVITADGFDWQRLRLP